LRRRADGKAPRSVRESRRHFDAAEVSHLHRSAGDRVPLCRHDQAANNEGATVRVGSLSNTGEGYQDEKEEENQAGRSGSSFNGKATKLIYFLAIATALRTLVADPATLRPGARGHLAASSLHGRHNSPNSPKVRR